MKKTLLLLLSLALLLTAFTGCGKQKDETPEVTEEPVTNVDLQEFFDEISETYEMAMMGETEKDMMDNFYPGLSDIAMKQCVAYMPMITSVVCEFVFVQCENSDDVQKVADILQKRVDEQAEGGAWYPEAMEGWAKAKVVVKNDYVLMIAHAENAEDIAADFAAQF